MDSLSNCTTPSFLKDLMRGSVAEAFAGSMIQLFDDGRKHFLTDVSEVAADLELALQAVLLPGQWGIFLVKCQVEELGISI